MNQLVTIELLDIPSFLEEIKLRNITRIYRTRDNNTLTYTGYDAASNVFISADVDLPEIKELQEGFKGSNSYRCRNREQLEDSYSVITESKQVFLHSLRYLGVSKKVVSSMRAMKKEELREFAKSLGEKGLLEEDDESSEGNLQWQKLEANGLNGIIKSIQVHMNIDTYKTTFEIAILGWSKIFEGIIDRHEKVFVDASIKIIPGKISIQT